MSDQVPLHPVDAAWWRMDRPENRMVIVAVLSFESGLPLEDLRRVAEQRLLRFERFRQRVVLVKGRLHWETQPEFEVAAHVTDAELPSPGDHAALEQFVGESASRALDPSRPLWDMQVVNLSDGSTSVIVRVHHCVADGMALIRVLLGIADGGDLPPMRSASRAHLARPTEVAASAIRELSRMSTSRTRIRYRIRRAMETVAALGKFAFLPQDSRTALRGKLGLRKQVAWAVSVDVAELKALARRMRVTVNDVLLATVAGGMRRYLENTSGPVARSTQIRMVIPVNLRPPGSPPTLGNQFGLALLRLPVGERDAEKRSHIVHRRMHALKKSVEANAAYGVLRALGGLPGAIQRRVVRSMTSACSGVMTNVPGPRVQLEFAGRPMNDVMFWVPRAGSVALGISVLTYAGKLRVGIAADSGIVPDPSALVEAYESELADLILISKS